jgi:hypothetical protein
LLATVDLFKALGGGWQAFEPAPKSASTAGPAHSETLASTNEDPS